MAAISFTANRFSKEDEERELKELSETEKEAILDDKYGRHIDNTGDVIDDDRDLSDDLIQLFHDAIEEIPPDKSGYLLLAQSEAEEVVDSECDLSLFLRCENYDPQRAALRRIEIFGEEHAFKPMTLNGAMKDVAPYMAQIPYAFRILPNDDHGRTVICIDRNGFKFKDYDGLVLTKIIWYLFHKALLEIPSTQENGVVLVLVDQTACWDFPPISSTRVIMKSISHCLPIRLRCIHVCASSLAASIFAPIVQSMLPRDVRLRFQLHSSLNQCKVLDTLESFGLQRKNLPTSIGGTYNIQPSWIECIRRAKERQRSTKRQKH